MSEVHVVVVGSGAAGTAAGLAARSAGARVTMVRGRTGATSLGSGAIDADVDDDAKDVAKALELFSFERATLATSAGMLRAARGRDLALCDLASVTGAVMLADVAHPSWDARALGAAYAELDSRGFVVRDVGLVLHTRDRAMHHAELAALHDDPARLATAAERIKEALSEGGAFGAVLLPPWLGVERTARSGALRARRRPLRRSPRRRPTDPLAPASSTPAIDRCRMHPSRRSRVA